MGGGKRVKNRDTYKIFSIGNIGGSKKYMSKENLIGLASYIENLKTDEKPNTLIIGSGLLPFIPVNGGPRNNNYSATTIKEINTPHDAAVFMKPIMQRIIKAVPEKCNITYVYGDDDTKNIEAIKGTLAMLYKHALSHKYDKESLESKLEEENLIINSRIEILNSMKEPKNKLLQIRNKDKVALDKFKADNKSTEGSKKYNEKLEILIKKLENDEKELRNINIKENMNREEKTEAEKRLKLLNKLYFASIQNYGANKHKLEQDLKSKTEKSIEISKKIKETSDSTELNKLTAESKALSSSIRLITNKIIEMNDLDEESKSNQENEVIDRFASNSQTNTESQAILTELSNLYYLGYLKDAFGRKRKIDFQVSNDENKKVINNKIISLGSGKYEYKFNLLTASSLTAISSGIISNANNNNVIEKTYLFNENDLLKGKYNKKLDTVVISEKNNSSSLTIEPSENGSPNLTVALSQGPFTDPEKVSECWNRGINTPYTKTMQNSALSSDMSIIKVHSNLENPFEYITITADKLKEAYNEKIKNEYKILNDKWEKIKDKDIDYNLSKYTNKDLEKHVALNKLPSELKDWELKKYYPEIKQRLEDSISKINKHQNEGDELLLGILSDTHIGNQSEISVITKSVEKMKEEKINVLFLMGDMLDGFYKNHGAEPNEVDSLANKTKVEDYLRKNNPEVLSKFYELNSKKMMPNIDEQVMVFLDKIYDLVKDVAERGGTILSVSGNHYNKTDGQGHRDESTVITNAIRLKLEGYKAGLLEANPKSASVGKLVKNIDNALKGLTAIVGGDFGAGEKSINGVNFALSHENAAKETDLSRHNIKKRTTALVNIAGHDHIVKIVWEGKKLIVKVPSTQEAISSFMKYLPIAVGEFPEGAINGCTVLKLEMGEENKYISSTNVRYYLARNLLRTSDPEYKISKAYQSIDDIKVNTNQSTSKQKSKNR